MAKNILITYYREALEALGDGKGWFIQAKHRLAAKSALDVLKAVSSERDNLAAKLTRNQKDYEQLPGWRQRVEQAEQQLRDANQARRGLEKRNTQLEKEVAEVQSKLDDFQRSLDLERKHLESQLEAIRRDGEYWVEEYRKAGDQASDERESHRKEVAELTEKLAEAAREQEATNSLLEGVRKDFKATRESLNGMAFQRDQVKGELSRLQVVSEKLRGELDAARRERDRYLDKLSAVALNAKQIQVIVEKGLGILMEEKPVAEAEKRAEPFIERAYANGGGSLYSQMMDAIKNSPQGEVKPNEEATRESRPAGLGQVHPDQSHLS